METTELLDWGEEVVPEVIRLLEEEIPGSSEGLRLKRNAEATYFGRYLHFKAPGMSEHEGSPLALWVFVTPEGAKYNLRGEPDVLGVELRHDSKNPLEPDLWG